MIDMRIHKRASRVVWLVFREAMESTEAHSDEWWQSLIMSCDKIARDYENTPAAKFTTDYIAICMNEISRVEKEGLC